MNFFPLFMKLAMMAAVHAALRSGAIQEPVPFVVSIQKRLPGGGYEHLCAGSIVDEQFVLTSAHCFIELSDPKRLSVLTGSNQLPPATGVNSTARRYEVRRVDIHPYFEPLQGRDIALVQIPTKFALDGKSEAIISYNMTTKVNTGTAGYLLGYGQKKAKQFLELVGFRTIDSGLCRYNFIYLTSTEVCAKTVSGRGACDGDSGGPLVSADFKHLIGVLSYGNSICNPRGTYIFTYLYRMDLWARDRMKVLR